MVYRLIFLALLILSLPKIAFANEQDLNFYEDPQFSLLEDSTPFEFASNLLRGRRPASENELRQWMREYRITKILSLDNYQDDGSFADREKTWAQSVGVTWVHYPMHHFLAASVTQLQQALGLLTADPSARVYVHCQYGKDRTGFVVAAHRIAIDHWTVDDAKKELYDFGHWNVLWYWDSVLYDFAATIGH